MKIPSPLVSSIPIVVLVALMAFSIVVFDGDVLGGAGQMVLLMSTAVCLCIGMIAYKTKWKSIEHAIAENVRCTAVAIVVLLEIGMLSSTWMTSGVVPAFIYYGVQMIDAKFFLLTSCVLCAVASVLTGSSWTTIATIGIALMGIGRAEGLSDGWVAGAIISGAYFGDKISPLSDTTVLASSVAGTPLFEHIRYMMLTTVPSMLIALIVFGIAGFVVDPTEAPNVELLRSGLNSAFNITPWVMVVPLLTILLMVKRLPSPITLFLGALFAAVAAIVFQPDVVLSAAGSTEKSLSSIFKGIMTICFGQTQPCTGVAIVDSLTATRGMSGMLNTIWLIITAMCFGGAMSATGMLNSIISIFKRTTKSRVGLVGTTVGSGIFLNLTTTDQYMSIVISTNLFRDLYHKQGYQSKLLSRTTEDAVTVTSVLVPWNTCGLTQSTVLGVATLAYLPYCIFNYVSPLMSIAMAAIGYKIYKKPESEIDIE